MVDDQYPGGVPRPAPSRPRPSWPHSPCIYRAQKGPRRKPFYSRLQPDSLPTLLIGYIPVAPWVVMAESKGFEPLGTLACSTAFETAAQPSSTPENPTKPRPPGGSEVFRSLIEGSNHGHSHGQATSTSRAEDGSRIPAFRISVDSPRAPVALQVGSGQQVNGPSQSPTTSTACDGVGESDRRIPIGSPSGPAERAQLTMILPGTQPQGVDRVEPTPLTHTVQPYLSLRQAQSAQMGCVFDSDSG